MIKGKQKQNKQTKTHYEMTKEEQETDSAMAKSWGLSDLEFALNMINMLRMPPEKWMIWKNSW